MRVLVVNAGSSSLKLRVLAPDDSLVAAHDLPAPRGSVDLAALVKTIGELKGVQAIGHRIVHGGTAFSGSVLIDAGIVERLRSLTDLAPLHQPKSLAAVDAVSALFPDVPAVACFDTAFHATSLGQPQRTRSRWNGGSVGTSGGMASMVCRTHTRRGEPRRSLAGLCERCGWSHATWGLAPHWLRSSMGGQWIRPWASHPWKVS
jgi:Acetokinase family